MSLGCLQTVGDGRYSPDEDPDEEGYDERLEEALSGARGGHALGRRVEHTVDGRAGRLRVGTERRESLEHRRGGV